MARIRSIDFLPEIFQTPTNEKFLNSTLDQLIQEPKLKQTQGYIGRKNAPGRTPEDGYVLEPTDRRTQYQLEPGVIFKDENGNKIDALTYMGLLDGFDTAGANVDNHDRLFRSEAYSWSPFIDFDKIVNYTQYYWLPNGPAPVNVSAATVFLTNDFDVTANESTYSISGTALENPDITLLRGGTYTFNVEQTGNPFYIQTQPGVDGTMPWASNISSRDVLGVSNNGEDDGTVTFVVPQATAQEFYHNLPDIGDVDLATDERMDAIADQLLDDVTGLLEIQNIDGKRIVFLDDTPGDAATLGWINNGVPVVNQADRYQIYRIQLDVISPTETRVRLIANQLVAVNERFDILYGSVYSNISFYKNASGYFEQVPLESASLDTLYYQDGTNPDRFGVINIVDQQSSAVLDVDDIIGQVTYTSPNGVIFTNGLKVKFRNEIIPVEYTDKEYYVEGVGTAIRLVLTTDLHVPESFAEGFPAPWDIEGWDTNGMEETTNAPTAQDYLIINRSSLDVNAWARSNRWFHIDVLRATATYNDTVFTSDNVARATRPIIEFDADLRLFNYGTHSKGLIDIIDFEETDAMSNVNGSEGYTTDGFDLVDGTRIIFANDNDLTIRDKIFTVQLIDPDEDGTNTINLVLDAESDTEEDDIVLLNNGLTLQGNVYTYNGTSWVESQAKLAVNQAPLFDMFDINGKSFNDFVAYPSTTFAGTKLFSYAEATGANDPVLGFPIRYLNIDNLGDIVFDNNLYTDTFFYVADNVSNENTPIHTSTLRKYYTRTEYTSEFGWTTSIEDSRQAQVIDVIYADEPIQLDVSPETNLSIPPVSITIDGTFVSRDSYTLAANVITFIDAPETGSELQIKVISAEISEAGYYEIPSNLSSNMFNENTSLLTLGTIRNHFNDLAQNILPFEGNIHGSNNIRDLGDVSEYGNLIVQQSAPLALAAMFMRNKEYNFFSSVEFAAQQYEKFKNLLIDWVEKHDVFDMTPGAIIDAAIKEINVGKTTASAFYWSDMLPTGEDFETTSYTVTAISTDTYTTLNTYDFLAAGQQAMLVYHNGELLVKDRDYIVATDGPRITLEIATQVDDVITINEYETTAGANVPSTPTKLGMFPRSVPEIFPDNTYANPVDVIRGHDGSITVSFGESRDGENDIRDRVLLEFEKRVYNNIKVNETMPIELADIISGVFRETEYTEDEITVMLSPSFLSWVGWNRIDYKSQSYNQNEEKTWNYSTATSKITGEPLTKANWRGIYIKYYDTDAPDTRPWEMVGLTEKPIWWEPYYGIAPYTSGNLVLWDDMEAGIIREPGNERVDERYARPGLTTILPVDSEGNLAMPLASVISAYTANDFTKSWQIGDIAPAEAAWMKSSAWPFAVQRLYALTKPAQYFSLMVDRDRYGYNSTAGQYLYDNSSRLDVRDIELQDDNLVKHSYINWIINYNRHFGYDSVDQLAIDLSNLDVNLCHHMASFTDKNNLKIFTDKSSPDSTNGSLLLPDESFDLLLYKNQPMDEIIYSSVIVQKVAGGYSVIGNSSTDPYFKIQASVTTGHFRTIEVGRTASSSTTLRVPLDFKDSVELVPYGHIYSSKQAVAEFIVGYNEYLMRAGLQFTTYEGANPVDWTQMVQEFIYWTDQGWAINSIINLNPAATQLEFERELHIVDDLNNLELTEQPLNQNRQPLDISDYVVDRIDNNFKLRMIDGNVISYLKFNLTSFEHLLILDNVSIFNDLIYDPVTGVRQHRVNLSGFTTFDWNGQVDAQGFLINEDNVKEWAPVNSYNRGDIILFKSVYWSASEKIQPSETFDFGQWVRTDYDAINKGLLPNIATKSGQMLEYYNSKTANLESDIDLLAYGLTGFRSRDYLRSLDLDDISQVNIYSDMIANKGTVKSLNLFEGVTLNNEEVNYTIFENWAIKRAEYGATSNRNYIELRLDEDLLPGNPSLVEIVNTTADSSDGDQLIPVSQIYKQSVKHTDKDIFPIRTGTNPDISLPSAGHVNADDVDIAVFDISQLDAEAIDPNTLVWVAKDTEVDWNVYRAVELDPRIIKVSDNLDGTLTLETDIAHDLVANGTIVISDVDDLVNGTHTVIRVFDSVNIVIIGELAANQTCILDVTGTLIHLVSARVGVPSDISGSVFDSNINSTETAWVSSYNGKPATFKKADPFALVRDEPNLFGTVSEYGQSISQGYNDAGLLVGNPGANEVHLYGKLGAGDYVFNVTLASNHSEIENYGTNVTLMKEWGAITAPGGAATPGAVVIVNRELTLDIITESQVFRSPDTAAIDDNSFGASIAMSHDMNWLFVGEPDNDKVYSYYRVEHETQELGFISDGIATVIDTSADIVANNANELSITVDNVALVPVTDYTFDGTTVTLTTVPTAGDVVIIIRKEATSYSGNDSTLLFAANLYNATTPESISVKVNNEIQILDVDYEYDGTTVDFTIGGPPPTGSGNILISLTSFRYAGLIDGSLLGIDFGEAIDVTSNGSQVTITAPGTNAEEGEAYVFDRIVERFVISDDNVLAYTANRTPFGSVFRNGVRLIPEGPNLTPDYSISGNVITLEPDVISIGDFLDVDTAEFALMQSVTAETPTASTRFGNAVTICKSKCSVYFGTELDGDGSVTRYINYSRMFGSITSKIANPEITAGSTIRVNNVEVDLPVTNLEVPAFEIIVGTTYTITTSGSTDFTVIGAADNFPGTVFTAFAVGSGSGKVQSSSTDIVTAINAATIPNVTASTADGFVTIELVNKEIQSLANKLDVLPGTAITTLADLGFELYTVGQTIVSPAETAQPQLFGSSLHIDLNLNQLVVGAPGGDTQYRNDATADNAELTADSGSTADAAHVVVGGGAVYTFDLLPDGDVFSGGKLVFGQQLITAGLSTGDKFGGAVNLVDGVLIAGSVDYNASIGRIVIYYNATDELSWTVSTTQNDTIDVELFNSVYIYDNDTLNVNRYLDYIEPLNGKILGVAQQNIDFTTVYDPTVYDNSFNGLLWGREQIGQMWWDVSNVRFLDYNQGDAKLASKLWGNVFDGSSIDVYQWVESTVVPSEYTGTGTVKDVDKFVTISEINKAGLLQNTYYYWVNKVETISVNSEKTLSAAAIASYIKTPTSSGISYAAFVAPNVIALYNCKDIIVDDTSVLYVEYDRIKNSNNVFVEYDLFRENHPTDFLSDSLYRKLQDSLCGVDDIGNLVPDTALSQGEKTGIEFRPRKSMFIDRYAALQGYLEKVNGILAKYTIAESRAYPLLNSEEPEPSAISGEWDQKVLTAEELSFQDFSLVPAGYKYLVAADENHEGLWVIYEVTATATLLLTRIQGYDTKRFWSLAHWYEADFNPFSKVDYIVTDVSGLTTLLNVEKNAVAKVTNNSVGSWELHQLTDGEWVRVGLENGTIQFDERLYDYSLGRFGYDVEVFDAQNLDEEPVIELRKIIQSINEELLIGDLSVERSTTVMYVFNYVLAEQPQVDWLYKTSMIDVTQEVRGLAQYAVYRKDNDDYLLDYIKESKPYHTKIKDFLLSYKGTDLFDGHVTDFDCPSVYDEAFEQYISPVLDDGAVLVTDPSNKKADDEVWQTEPWKQWYDNHTLSVGEVVINNPGSGYTITPRVIVTGNNTIPAEMTAVVVSGAITSVIIDNPGAGYLETPIITFDGGDGVDAAATARLENTLVRTIGTTIKYDRYEYESKVALWEDNIVTTTRNLVFKYNGTLEEASENDDPPTLYRVTELYDPLVDDNTVFDINKFEEVPYITTVDGARHYTDATADTNLITADTETATADAANGLDEIELKYLKEGIARWYMLDGDWINENDNSESKNFVRVNNGVYRVITFEETTEFLDTKYEVVELETLGGIDRTTGYYVADVNNPGLDLSLLINGIAYPGVEVSGNGFALDIADLDAIYESDYLDTYLGTRSDDINVDGSEFIDTLHSHAPEELVPCSIFDTLDIKVFSRPGADFAEDGHAFAVGGTVYSVAGATATLSFAGIVPHPIKVLVANVTTGKMLYDADDFDDQATINNENDYTVDWENMNVEITGGITSGDSVKVFVYEIGGGRQINRTAFYGIEIAGDTFNVPVGNSEIYDIVAFVGGVDTAVTTAYVDNQTTAITLPSAPLDTDFVSITIFGVIAPQYEESYPVTQVFDMSDDTGAVFGIAVFGLDEFGVATESAPDAGIELYGKWRENAIVEQNGLRLRPPEGARYIGNGATTDYLFPLHGGFIYDSVADSEVTVFVNDQALTLNVDFTVSPQAPGSALFGSAYFGSSVFSDPLTSNIPRYVSLTVAPNEGDIVNVYLHTASDYWWNGTKVDFNVSIANTDIVAITTFKDDRELDILTQVFNGPTTVTEEVKDVFESTGFDTTGFDFAFGVNSSINLFTISREIITNAGSMWVTVDGERLHAGTGYQIVGDDQVILNIPLIASDAVVAITTITDNVVTDGVGFRLFKDMRDNVGMYKMADTFLMQDVLPTDDIIYVMDASVLGKPDLDLGKFGMLIINGERITYRERDTVLNTVSGLRRGTAGTATPEDEFGVSHYADAIVYDVSSKSLVQWDYDQIWYEPGTQDGPDSGAIPLQDQTTSPALFIKS